MTNRYISIQRLESKLLLTHEVDIVGGVGDVANDDLDKVVDDVDVDDGNDVVGDVC